MKDMSDKLLSE